MTQPITEGELIEIEQRMDRLARYNEGSDDFLRLAMDVDRLIEIARRSASK